MEKQYYIIYCHVFKLGYIRKKLTSQEVLQFIAALNAVGLDSLYKLDENQKEISIRIPIS